MRRGGAGAWPLAVVLGIWLGFGAGAAGETAAGPAAKRPDSLPSIVDPSLLVEPGAPARTVPDQPKPVEPAPATGTAGDSPAPVAPPPAPGPSPLPDNPSLRSPARYQAASTAWYLECIAPSELLGRWSDSPLGTPFAREWAQKALAPSIASLTELGFSTALLKDLIAELKAPVGVGVARTGKGWVARLTCVPEDESAAERLARPLAMMLRPLAAWAGRRLGPVGLRVGLSEGALVAEFASPPLGGEGPPALTEGGGLDAQPGFRAARQALRGPGEPEVWFFAGLGQSEPGLALGWRQADGGFVATGFLPRGNSGAAPAGAQTQLSDELARKLPGAASCCFLASPAARKTAGAALAGAGVIETALNWLEPAGVPGGTKVWREAAGAVGRLCAACPGEAALAFIPPERLRGLSPFGLGGALLVIPVTDEAAARAAAGQCLEALRTALRTAGWECQPLAATEGETEWLGWSLGGLLTPCAAVGDGVLVLAGSPAAGELALAVGRGREANLAADSDYSALAADWRPAGRTAWSFSRPFSPAAARPVLTAIYLWREWLDRSPGRHERAEALQLLGRALTLRQAARGDWPADLRELEPVCGELLGLALPDLPPAEAFYYLPPKAAPGSAARPLIFLGPAASAGAGAERGVLLSDGQVVFLADAEFRALWGDREAGAWRPTRGDTLGGRGRRAALRQLLDWLPAPEQWPEPTAAAGRLPSEVSAWQLTESGWTWIHRGGLPLALGTGGADLGGALSLAPLGKALALGRLWQVGRAWATVAPGEETAWAGK